jgi:hypothetical protein
MSSTIDRGFSNKINKYFAQNIKLFNISESEILIVTKDDKVYILNHYYDGILISLNDENFEANIESAIVTTLCGKNVIDVSYGLKHTVARTANGELFCWGQNDLGQLGIGSLDKLIHKPEYVSNLKDEFIINTSCGAHHSVVLTGNGEVYAWGLNRYGQIGVDKENTVIFKPMKLSDFNNEKVIAVACGGCHSLALTERHIVYGWGSNKMGQLGFMTMSFIYKPKFIYTQFPIRKIACGSEHSLYLTNKGEIVAYGSFDGGGNGCSLSTLLFKENIDMKSMERKLKSELRAFLNVFFLFVSFLDVFFNVFFLFVYFLNVIFLIVSFLDKSFRDESFRYESFLDDSFLDESFLRVSSLGLPFFLLSFLLLFFLIVSFLSVSFLGGSYSLKFFCQQYDNNFKDLFEAFFKILSKISSYNLEKPVFGPFILNSIHQNILVFDKSEKIHDIASHPLHNLSVAESFKKFYIWGTIIHKGTRKYIRNPQKVELKSIDDIYQKNLKITFKPISGNFRSNDIFIDYEKYIVEFEELKKLGEGSFGEVFEAKCFKSGSNFAIKKMEFKEESNQNLLREVENFVIAKDLDETYIVKHFSFWFQNKHTDINGKSERFVLFYIQMELCQMTLTNIIDEISKDVDKIFIQPLNTQEVSDFLSLIAFYIASNLIIEILEGVNYLHKQQPPLIHRDLKPDNILLKIENNINNRFVKIADFGLLAIHKYAEQSHSQDKGTPKYMAPEVIEGKKYDIKADIYSVGKVMKVLFRIDLNE